MRSIAHISDLHFGRIDPPVAEALVDDLRLHPATLLVVSGDFTQRARVGQYTQAAEYLKRLPVPQLVVPGNHDVPMYNFIRRFFFPLTRYRRHISQDLSPAFQDDELFVLGANTARSFTQKSGWFAKEQLTEICRRLSAAPPGLTKVLVTHHPFIPPPGHPRENILRGASRALTAFEHCGVDVLLAGHLHRAYHNDVRSHHVGARQSVLSIQAGTATSTRRRHDPNAWNYITLEKDAVSVEVRAWDGRKFVQSSVSHYGRVEHIWLREM
ncbi:MAG TPA: metallophosphoesterase [Tepidisphaeraceae bacterium]|jgi:3',5'-cyclic AMP phosphodiesterase CpdA|nr:metallophosphoesterase [Tepidisphaeraceae bacterium]